MRLAVKRGSEQYSDCGRKKSALQLAQHWNGSTLRHSKAICGRGPRFLTRPVERAARVRVYMKGLACLIALVSSIASAPGRSNSHPGSLSRQLLAAHNSERKRVGAPPLVWSEQLSSYAQQWADTLLAQRRFSHRSNHVYGENLYEITGAAASPSEVVGAWAGEAQDFDYRANACRSMCGHYTQIVWRETRSVGCAVARDPRREIWVCNYAPPGNVVGERPY